MINPRPPSVFRFRQLRCRLIGPLILVVAALLSSCAHAPPAPSKQVAAFSSARPAGPYPGGWHVLGFSKFRKETHYALVDDCGTTIVEARADGSSSGLIELVDIDPSKYPWLTWRWKVHELVPGADNTRRETEDAPARIEVSFDGDATKLSIGDRLWAAQVKALTGTDLPYATLEYVWGDGAPKEAIIENTWTSRIRMLLVESGPERVGGWVTETRNVYEDYRLVFGEAPGRIIAIGVVTDTDATGTKAEARYGDIALLPAKPTSEPGAEVASPGTGNRPQGPDCSVQAK